MKLSIGSDGVLQYAKGVVLSIIIAIVATLLFALVITFTGASELTVKIVNQIIKTVAVLLGCLYSVSGNKGFVKGFSSGITSGIVLSLIFALISGKFSFVGILWDCLFCAVIGSVGGLIAVNVKR